MDFIRRTYFPFAVTAFSLLLLLFSTGCPMHIEYKLGEPGEVKIDERLLGRWQCTDDVGTVQRAEITKKSETLYEIKILEEALTFTSKSDEFEAWIVHFEGLDFLIAEPQHYDERGNYYYYTFRFEEDELYTREVDDTAIEEEMIKSADELREAFKRKLKKNRLLDVETKWTRMP